MQPNLKGAGLAGPLSQGSSLTQQWAGLAGGGQPGLWAVLAEQRSRAGGTEPGRMCSDSPGVGARDQRPGNTSSKELARKGLGRSQHVAVCIRPHRWTLRLERY